MHENITWSGSRQHARRKIWLERELTRRSVRDTAALTILALFALSIGHPLVMGTSSPWYVVTAELAGLIAVAALLMKGMGYLAEPYIYRHEAAGPPSRSRVPQRLTILALGTRGDVEPCLVLAAGIQERPGMENLQVVVCGPAMYQCLAEQYEVEYRSCGVDRLEVTAAWAQAKNLQDFIVHAAEAYSEKFQDIADAFWTVCCENQTDIVVASTFAVHFGIHIAEALSCPFWALKYAPETPSAQSPPFGCTTWKTFPFNLGIVNKSRHWARLIMAVLASQKVNFSDKQNKFREDKLQLPDMSLDILERLGSKLHVLYAYSPALVKRPDDWPKTHYVTGFLLDQPRELSPAEKKSLTQIRAFVQQSKQPPICVCFGSMHTATDVHILQTCVEASKLVGRQCIIVSSVRLAEYEADPKVLCVSEVPHDHLFSLCQCVIHHGGAGTTARALVHGLPTLIIPVLQFYDQVGWAISVENQGAGIHVPANKVFLEIIQNSLIKLLDPAQGYKSRAEQLGRQFHNEDGVALAIQCLFGYSS